LDEEEEEAPSTQLDEEVVEKFVEVEAAETQQLRDEVHMLQTQLNQLEPQAALVQQLMEQVKLLEAKVAEAQDSRDVALALSEVQSRNAELEVQLQEAVGRESAVQARLSQEEIANAKLSQQVATMDSMLKTLEAEAAQQQPQQMPVERVFSRMSLPFRALDVFGHTVPPCMRH
jgi:hypothetical protein